jgi:hypothetical protein
VDGLDAYDRWWPETFRLVHNEGRGLLITGTREWRDYSVAAAITPHMCAAFGLAVRTQGMQRYYALLLSRSPAGVGVAQIVKQLDGELVLAEAAFDWSFGVAYELRLEAEGARLRGSLREAGGGPSLTLDALDAGEPLAGGGIALIVDEGRIATDAVRVGPLR